VPRREERERERQHAAEQRADDSHVERLHHGVEREREELEVRVREAAPERWERPPQPEHHAVPRRQVHRDEDHYEQHDGEAGASQQRVPVAYLGGRRPRDLQRSSVRLIAHMSFDLAQTEMLSMMSTTANITTMIRPTPV